MTKKKTSKNELVMTPRARFKRLLESYPKTLVALFVAGMILGAGLADLAR